MTHLLLKQISIASLMHLGDVPWMILKLFVMIVLVILAIAMIVIAFKKQ